MYTHDSQLMSVLNSRPRPAS